MTFVVDRRLNTEVMSQCFQKTLLNAVSEVSAAPRTSIKASARGCDRFGWWRNSTVKFTRQLCVVWWTGSIVQKDTSASSFCC